MKGIYFQKTDTKISIRDYVPHYLKQHYINDENIYLEIQGC